MLFSKLTTAMGVVAHDALLHFLRVVLVAAGINTVLAIVVLLHAQLPLAFAGAASEPPTQRPASRLLQHQAQREGFGS